MVEKGLTQSRERARALIMSGKVLINDQPADKPAAGVSDADVILLRGEDIRYVSRGGLKLEAALQSFHVRTEGRVCLDVGASTGGFTDCLLQHGAGRVFAVDVGYGQLAWKLRQDPRVLVFERTNIRYMSREALPEPVDLVVIDVSFISLRIVAPAILKLMKKDADILALIKPQFEVGKGRVGKGGVVKDADMHEEVIRSLSAFFTEIGLFCEAVMPSPVLGPKGNKEFVMFMKGK